MARDVACRSGDRTGSAGIPVFPTRLRRTANPLQGAHDLLLDRRSVRARLALFGSLIKLVPTDWGPPTFEIDGIKMLPTAQVSPYEDAGHKVGADRAARQNHPRYCGGLGYFAAWCLAGGARNVCLSKRIPT
jgi:predicted methyltransferase